MNHKRVGSNLNEWVAEFFEGVGKRDIDSELVIAFTYLFISEKVGKV